MEKDNQSDLFEKKIYSLGIRMSLIFISIAIIGFLVLLLPMISQSYDYIILGSLGDTIGGIINPIIAISASLLTFLAFYIQYQANKQVQRQFEKQQIDDLNNFEYKRFKERINMIIHEFDNFNIAFHKGKLITRISDIPPSGGKKYNFIGIQGINLFLIEYFRDKKSKEANDTKEFDREDSFHSVLLNISNLIILFHNTHESVIKSSIPEEYTIELKELLHYVYVSKMNFVLEHYRLNNPAEELKKMIETIINHYSPGKLK
ncbi:MAG: hypothetical protein CMH46_16650 [Muricauda sp.]|nr:MULTISPECIES: hypothetical protein [unclassified Allomuricauda]MAU17159.1 hypothetical protein [Allomuricauda sp.]|tara:strand:- start:165 stop:947 length:783 start_codon:yes stop_codon:yes gene_type:complete